MKKSAINRQRGSIIIPVAVSLLVGLILLGGVQLGYYFYMKRELQNTADLAVLSGVQLLSEGEKVCGKAHPAKVAAMATIAQNFKHGTLTPVVDCGTWDPAKEVKAVEADLEKGITGVEGEYESPQFFEPESNDEELNALRVSLSYKALPFMPFSSAADISVEAIAKKSAMPVAAFSVGPSLLRLQEGLLTDLLEDVGLGVIGTQILSHEGLANVRITPAGLLEALGVPVDVNADVGKINEALNGEVVLLEELLVASLKAVGGEEVLGVNIEAINSTLETNVGNLTTDIWIPLGTEGDSRGLFAEIVAPAQSALNAEVGLSDILNVVASVATKHNAVSLGSEEPIINLGGLLRVEAKTTVIEPPSIGIGGPGTTAYSASVRAFLRLCVNLTLTGCDESESGRGFGLLELKVDIPVGIEVVTGKATLGPMCERSDVNGNPIAEITTESTVLGLCIGDITEENVFSTSFSCTAPRPANKNIASLKALGINLLNLNSSAAISALQTPPSDRPEDGQADYSMGDEDDRIKYLTNTLNVGTTVSTLVGELLGTGIDDKSGWAENDTTINDTATKIWNNSKDKEDFAHCTNNIIKAETKAGFDCRNDIRKDALESLENDFGSLPGASGLISELLEGLGGLVDGVVNLAASLVKVLLGFVGGLLGASIEEGDACAKFSKSGLSPITYTGTEEGCIAKIGEALEKVEESANSPQNNQLSPLLELVVGILKGPLDGLGNVLSNLLSDLGINVNKVRTELISLDCNNAAQLVY